MTTGRNILASYSTWFWLVILFLQFVGASCFGTSLSLLGNYSYSVSGNSVVLHADKIQNNASGGFSGTIRMELWAFSSEFPGTTSGYKLASYALGQLNGGQYYYNISSGSIAFSLPPPGTWHFSLLIREYTATGGDGYTTRDYGNFSTPKRVAGGAFVGDVQIFGLTSWLAVGNTVNLQVEKVGNICNLGTSGSLRLDLWATTSPYDGETISGYRFGSLTLNPLTGGYEYNNINRNLTYISPPAGIYYVTLTLSEYHDGEYLILDYLNYDSYLTSGNAPSTPIAKAASSLTANGFVANWNSASGASGYLLDVSTSSTFNSYVGGYHNLDVGKVLSTSVGGLAEGVTYYYRVKAYNFVGTSGNSSTVAVTTPCTVYIMTAAVGGGTVTGGGIKPCGTTVKLVATPGAGRRFEYWTEDGIPVSLSPIYQFTANQDRDLVANFTDGQKPVIKITSGPAEKATVTNSLVIISGTATDNVAVSDVYYQLNNGDFQWADGDRNWTALFDCVPGTNVFTVKAIDTSGNASLLVTRRFYYSMRGAVTLVAEPANAGIISRNFTGTVLEIGRSYTVTAAAKPGQIFTGWTGSVNSTNAVLKFVMQADLVLQANFVPSPFVAVKGTYNGLFFEADAIRSHSAGYFNLTLSADGVFSGKVLLEGATNSFSGKFDVDGYAQTKLVRPGKSTITNSWQFDFAAQQIGGTMSSSNAFSYLLAEKVVWNATLNKAVDYAGKYTMVIPGAGDPASSPLGDGYATLSISTAGVVTMTGALADGTAIKQSTSISQDGAWPLYVPLYAGKGLVLGWVYFSKLPTNSLSGDVSWISLAKPMVKYYPYGFTNETSIIGSYFQTPSSTRMLNLTSGTTVLTGGNLADSLVNSFILNSNNTLTVSGTNHVALSLNKLTGLLTGSFYSPATRKTTTVNGVVLQKQNQARGFFLGTNQSGSLLLQEK